MLTESGGSWSRITGLPAIAGLPVPMTQRSFFDNTFARGLRGEPCRKCFVRAELVEQRHGQKKLLCRCGNAIAVRVVRVDGGSIQSNLDRHRCLFQDLVDLALPPLAHVGFFGRSRRDLG